jgi:hypothetical protein
MTTMAPGFIGVQGSTHREKTEFIYLKSIAVNNKVIIYQLISITWDY